MKQLTLALSMTCTLIGMHLTATPAEQIAPFKNAKISLQDNTNHRKLLITGCARGGTTYITDLLIECGLDVGHEHLEGDGCVAWQAAVDIDYGAWWQRFPDGKIEFDIIFHQVRNPLGVISSLYNKTRKEDAFAWAHAWEYICDCIPEIHNDEPLVVKCAKYWYYWNLAAENRASWTYRIEDIDTVFDEMGRRLGLKLDRAALERVSRETNTAKPWEDKSFAATWKLLEQKLDPEFLTQFKRLTEHYGYLSREEKKPKKPRDEKTTKNP